VRHDRRPEELARFSAKLRVYAINDQDDTGPWIVANFPDLFYVLSKHLDGRDRREAAYRGMYLGGDESLTSRAWLDAHVRENHGPLGALYPAKTWRAAGFNQRVGACSETRETRSERFPMSAPRFGGGAQPFRRISRPVSTGV
jgi:hypothetical protein